jgi:hypothetical protein
MRWDPHPTPKDDHPGFGVIYAASTPVAAFAEVFQQSRVIAVNGTNRVLSAWFATRSLRLLDLTSNWPLLNGAARALQHAPKSTCRAWAREVRAQGPSDLDGLIADSTLVGGDARLIVVWQTHLPPAPALSRALDDPTIAPLVLAAAQATGYAIA